MSTRTWQVVAVFAVAVICLFSAATATGTPAAAQATLQNGLIGWTGGYALEAADSDGSNRHVVADGSGGAVQSLGWSADGRVVYDRFDSGSGGSLGLYVANADGSDEHLVVNPGGGSLTTTPDWSAASGRIVFASDRGNGLGLNELELWAVNPDGSDLSRMVGSVCLESNYDPRWSPDGTKIAFIRISGYCTPDPFGMDVWVVDVPSGAVTRVTEGLGVQDVSWSPDGTKLVYSADNGAGSTDVWLADADGSNPVKLSDTGGVGGLDWAPDGTAIVFSNGTDGWLYLMDPDGGNQRRLVNLGFGAYVHWQPVPAEAPDTVAPTVGIELTAPNGGTPDGQNGWFVTGPVTGTVSADDTASGGSNITSIDCGALALTTSGLGTPTASGTFSIAADGVTHISCTASDSGGNTSAPATKDVMLDTHVPTLAPAISPTPILLHGSATATPNATDGTSGVGSQSCDAVDASAAGLHTLTCSASDNAGHQATTPVSYLVEYKILGFFSPAPQSKWKVGQTVPIKVALADVNGVRIPDTEAQGLLSPTCRVSFSATGAQTAGACTKYDTGNHQFVYTWKLGQQTGNATIAVTVSYPGTTTTTVLSEGIVITK